MTRTTYKLKDARWEQFRPHHSPTYLWANLQTHTSTHTCIQQFCKLYLRYIDDLFLIWTGTKDQFKGFISNLNNQHPSIKFTYKISNTSIDFLVTVVYIKNRRIHTSIFKKPTNTQNYLHYKAEHLRTLKNSIPFGQILRIKRICSEAREFLQNCKKMLDKFSERGYPKTTIQEAFCKSTTFQRENLLKSEYPLLLPTIEHYLTLVLSSINIGKSFK